MPIVQSRRRFLTQAGLAWVTGLGGAGAVALGGGRRSFAAEPPPEITTIRLNVDPVTCVAPFYVAEELLRTEGFTEIRYVELTDEHIRRSVAENTSVDGSLIAHDEVDFSRSLVPNYLAGIAAGAPITILAGLHIGCFEIIGRPDIHNITDLKGRSVMVDFDPSDTLFVKIMANYVGLDPDRDIHWVARGVSEPMDLYLEGKIDAFVTAAPFNRAVRARNIGHVIVDTLRDHPWSQYYCCVVATNTKFASQYPVATKRALRAILKAADLCASEPARVAKSMVDRGFVQRYEDALQGLREVRYDIWRDYDPEDTLRFYALRMHEARLTKSLPKEFIAQHADWRFLNEIKRELKT